MGGTGRGEQERQRRGGRGTAPDRQPPEAVEKTTKRAVKKAVQEAVEEGEHGRTC